MALIDVFYPKICVGCRAEGEYICRECQGKLVKPEEICPMCGRASIGGWCHARCKTKDGIERLLVGLVYRGMVQDCLKKVKYKSAWGIVEFLYGLAEFPEVEGVITSVPMHQAKERGRGFNQAEILANLLASSLPACLRRQGDSRKVELLERVRETKPMFGLTKTERQENMRGAFRVKSQKIKELTQPRIILVDDVWTTGATMRECARTLKRVGIGEVWAVALAR